MITIINHKLDVPNIKLITSILPIVLLVYFYRMGGLYFILLWPIAGLYAYGIILNSKALSQVWFWILISIIMSTPMISNWLEPANHHFVLSYLVLAIAVSISYSPEMRDFRLKEITASIIILLFTVSALQKLISPVYISGEYTTYLSMVGGFFKPIYRISGELTAVFANNNQLVGEMLLADPNQFNSIQFSSPIANIRTLALLLSICSITLELLVATVFILAKSEKFKHWVLLIFIYSLFITRLEMGFLVTLSLLGLAFCMENSPFKLIYLLNILLFLAIMIAGIGYP